MCFFSGWQLYTFGVFSDLLKWTVLTGLWMCSNKEVLYKPRIPLITDPVPSWISAQSNTLFLHLSSGSSVISTCQDFYPFSTAQWQSTPNAGYGLCIRTLYHRAFTCFSVSLSFTKKISMPLCFTLMTAEWKCKCYPLYRGPYF